MTHTRADYIQRKIDLQLQRARHVREAPVDCQCPIHLADGRIQAMIRQRIEAERAARPEVPF